jgi:hypothetical protein
MVKCWNNGMLDPVNQAIFLNRDLIPVDSAIQDKKVANFEQAY